MDGKDLLPNLKTLEESVQLIVDAGVSRAHHRSSKQFMTMEDVKFAFAHHG
jgi:hypothetical protein